MRPGDVPERAVAATSVCLRSGRGCRRGRTGREAREDGEWKAGCITLDRDIQASQSGCRPKTGTESYLPSAGGLVPDPRTSVSIGIPSKALIMNMR